MADNENKGERKVKKGAKRINVDPDLAKIGTDECLANIGNEGKREKRAKKINVDPDLAKMAVEGLIDVDNKETKDKREKRIDVGPDLEKVSTEDEGMQIKLLKRKLKFKEN